MGVNPVPDNILSRRGGSRTARPPNPTVIPTHHSVVPAQIPPPQTRGQQPIPHSHSHPSFLPAPPTCHSERSEAEPRNLAALPLVVLADAGTHPPISVIPTKNLR